MIDSMFSYELDYLIYQKNLFFQELLKVYRCKKNVVEKRDNVILELSNQ